MNISAIVTRPLVKHYLKLFKENVKKQKKKNENNNFALEED